MKPELIPIRRLASGETLHLPVFRFEGRNKAAPSAYLQASLHGSEVQGNWVIAELLERGLAAAPAVAGARKRLKLPLVHCRHPARPGEELTPERLDAILLAQEVARDTTPPG